MLMTEHNLWFYQALMADLRARDCRGDAQRICRRDSGHATQVTRRVSVTDEIKTRPEENEIMAAARTPRSAQKAPTARPSRRS